MWKQFDDDKVKHYSFSDLQADSFGGMNNSNMLDSEMNAFIASTGGSFGKNAYMLVYERQKKSPIIEYVKKTQDQATLECANTALSRDAEI